jgi:hypothetical protein
LILIIKNYRTPTTNQGNKPRGQNAFRHCRDLNDPTRRVLDQLGVANDLMLRWGEGG